MAADRQEGRHHGELMATGATMLYAAVGARLTRYDMDVQAAALTERGAITLPAGVQYAWRHHALPLLYVACSDGRPGHGGSRHFACVVRIGPGKLEILGEPVPLRSRPVHLTLDRDSRHVLVTHHAPSGVSVFRIGDDGLLGAAVPQPPFELGKTAHQLLVSPANDLALLPIRGSDAAQGRPEEPGSLVVLGYRDGVLTQHQTIAPDGGFGFGPRHVDFHPSRPWVYMSIERQNEIALFELGARVEGPRFRTTTLEHPHDEKPRQLGGAVHVHPSGRVAYVSNRADGTVEHQGEQVFNGGENSIAVFALDPQTGEPRRVQNAATLGIHARTFHVDPSGRLLVAASMTSRKVLDGGTARLVPAGLTVFRIGEDGRLAFVRKYDADVGSELMFWVGMAEA